MHLINNEPYDHSITNGTHHVGERAIVFRFAHYLQCMIENDPIFSDVIVDCEYNRNGIECKALPSFPNGTYPDLIIHKRGSNNKNILILEFKTYWNSNTLNDEYKLSAFMDINGKYKYKHGYSILISKKREDVVKKVILMKKCKKR